VGGVQKYNTPSTGVDKYQNNLIMPDFEVGDYVQAIGLVNSQQLNRQVGKVVKRQNASGRFAVQFPQQGAPAGGGAAGSPSAPPKLIKATNLRKPVIPLDKDEPWSVFLNPDGSEAGIKIENGKGKICVDCKCDLDGKYHLHEMGEYR
jgi:hypothetical protein